MKKNALIWGDREDKEHVASCRLICEKYEHNAKLYAVFSYEDLESMITRLDIDFVLAVLDFSDPTYLYQVQCYQNAHFDVPLLAIARIQGGSHPKSDIERFLSLTLGKEDSQPVLSQESVNPAPPIENSEKEEKSVRLTRRQQDVLNLLMEGKSNKQIARELFLSEGTVKIHCMAIFREIGAKNRTQAAIRAEKLIDRGLLQNA